MRMYETLEQPRRLTHSPRTRTMKKEIKTVAEIVSGIHLYLAVSLNLK